MPWLYLFECSLLYTSDPGLLPTCASHSLATAIAPLSGSARFVVMSRLQEMQHYICLQPTGTRTRSCYVIKECYPERVCVWLNPLGLATIDSIQANQNGEREQNCCPYQLDEQITFDTAFSLRFQVLKISQKKPSLVVCVCFVRTVFMLVFILACDYV